MGALAPAKLNLWLLVRGRRPDGYHELETVFQTVDWGDDVEVERTNDGRVSLESSGLAVPVASENLAVRAAEAWFAAAGVAAGAHVRLKKRIPLGGGLAGGSSDAAAVLRELQRGPNALTADRLQEVAASLGSDVPFLVAGGTAVGRGRGEILEPVPPGPPMTLVLAIPPFGTETARVYAGYGPASRPAPEGGLESVLHALAANDPEELRRAHHNDLASPALRAYPELRRFTMDVERRLGRPPCMTGSGSTLFDAPDEGTTAEVMSRLEGLPGTRVVVRTWGSA